MFPLYRVQAEQFDEMRVEELSKQQSLILFSAPDIRDGRYLRLHDLVRLTDRFRIHFFTL